jgi:uncharacterized protein (DUF488 family)
MPRSTGKGAAKPRPAIRLFTIGHSNHTLGTLLELLRRHGVETVVDVRSYPRSRHVPHFDGGALRAALAEAGIGYRSLGSELGGRPREREFYDARGRVRYERVAASPAFERGIGRLKRLAAQLCVSLLCSEENPARCHRHLLIGPALEASRVVVGHIRRDGRVQTEGDLTGAPADERGEVFQIRLL